MIFNFTKHNTSLYNTLLTLSRNLFFYNKISLKDTFETRIYLMFIHFSVILIMFKNKKIKFNQDDYDSFFYCIENNLREMGYGDVAVNKKMKVFNKVFYDILLKLSNSKDKFKINEALILKYFSDLDNKKNENYALFDQYFVNFYHFCFGLDPKSVIKEALKFKS